MPIHLLSMMNVPKGVLKGLKIIFSNFLWVANEGRKKRKSMIVCLSIEEGGLGIRDLSDVLGSLFMNFSWKMLKGDSIWSKFFKAKYVRHSHIAALTSYSRGSRFWKRVFWVLPHLK